MLIVAALILSPTSLSTGIDSPVKADSLIEVAPSIITPSTGTDSPGFTIKISPTTISSTGKTISLPDRSTIAVLGFICNKLFNALVVRPFDIDSNILPIIIKVGIIAADSK